MTNIHLTYEPRQESGTGAWVFDGQRFATKAAAYRAYENRLRGDRMGLPG